MRIDPTISAFVCLGHRARLHCAGGGAKFSLPPPAVSKRYKELEQLLAIRPFNDGRTNRGGWWRHGRASFIANVPGL